MTFLHWGLLGGAAFVAVPIILHLVMRRRPRHLEFPALRFIKERQHANKRRLRLRHLLLLALRCAVLVLLALALARPRIKATGTVADMEAPSAVAMVFDTNPRMEYRHQNLTRLEAARETALWLLPQLAHDSDIAVVDARPAAPGFSIHSGAAKQRIKTLAATPVARPMTEVLEDTLRLLAKSDKPRKEVYVFTDLARASWPDTSAQSLERELKALEDAGIYLIDVGVTDVRNFGLADARLSSQVISSNMPLSVQTTVIHAGPPGEPSVELYLMDRDGTPSRRSQQNVALRVDESAPLVFQLGGLKPGVQQGYLKIVGTDGLPADDTHYFTFDVKQPWRVLIASAGKPATAGLFLSEALAPSPLKAKGAAAFACELVPIERLENIELAGYSAVCLLDPTPLSDSAWQRLSAFAARGGGVAIFLGRNARPIEAFNTPAAQELLPGKLKRQWRAGEQDIYLSGERLQHPLLAKFRPLEGSVPWSSLPVFTHWQLGPTRKGDDVVMSFTDGQPAIIERPLERGRVLTMTTPISDPASRRDTWNLLPTGEEPWPFVMLANELMLYLVGSREASLNYTVGETAVLALQADQRRPIFSVTTPRGDTLRQAADAARSSVAITFTEFPGNYQVRAGGDRGGVSLGFSVNLQPNVSQLERLSPSDLKKLFGEKKVRVARNREEIDRNVSMERVGRELYPWVIVLMALVLAAEQLLSNRFYKREPEGAAGHQAREEAVAPRPAKQEPVGAP